MSPSVNREERERYIADNLDAEGRLKGGLDPRTFISETADATILSYPKSGKTWLSYMATAYIAAYLNAPPKTAVHINKKGALRTLSPEVQERFISAVATRRTPERWAPILQFGHKDSMGSPFFASKPVRPPASERIVILLRDPRDVVVSHYHHVMTKNAGRIQAGYGKWQLPEDFEIGEFVRSEHFGIRHILSYVERWGGWAAENDAPVFYYEDFVDSPERTLAGFLTAIGVSSIEPETVSLAIGSTNFEAMANAESTLHANLGVADDDPAMRRMRKGKVGGYRDEVSAEDAAFMTRVMTTADHPAWRRYLVPRADRPADSPA